MPELRKELIEKLKTDDKLVFAIAQGLNRRFATVAKWVNVEDKLGMLTSLGVLLIIQKETGLSEDEILEPTTSAATA